MGRVVSRARAGGSLIFGVMNVINLAYGALVVIAAYFVCVSWYLLGVDPMIMIPLIMLIMRSPVGPTFSKRAE